MDVTNRVCTACNRAIDAYAKLCPFCGANPDTGEKPDTEALIQEVFRPKEMTAADNVLEFARHRQGIVMAVAIGTIFLLLTGLHQYVTWRNAREVTDAPPVPLTEVTDLNSNPSERPAQLPDLDFQFTGQPQRMKTLIIEPGAVAPPEVVAAQQASTAPALGVARAAAPGQNPQAAPPVPGPVIDGRLSTRLRQAAPLPAAPKPATPPPPAPR